MDTNLFSGLEGLGLSGMDGMSLFETEKPKEEEKQKAPEIKEEDFILDKSQECPLCSFQFKSRTLRTGKARLLGTDMDLRPKFENIEPLKYDVISCPKCGFTALTRFYKPVTPGQRKNLVEKISMNYKGDHSFHATYTYEEAIGRYKLALVNAVVKSAKASEKAYICLRAGWMCRSYKEELEAAGLDQADNKAKYDQAVAMENEFLKNAYDGFTAAIAAESFPMCGMDEPTVEYLLACLALRFNQFDVCSKFISMLISSPSTSSRMKDKVRDLKDMAVAKMKAGN